MNGCQITFFTRQDRRHKGKQIGEWLIQLVQELGLRGASCRRRKLRPWWPPQFGAFFRAHRPACRSSDRGLTEEATRLFDRLKKERVHLFYVKTPVEFGVLGREQ
jgi:uncharacterized protein